jgi:hypothetical protein
MVSWEIRGRLYHQLMKHSAQVSGGVTAPPECNVHLGNPGGILLLRCRVFLPFDLGG